jgi:hypothetical protein
MELCESCLTPDNVDNHINNEEDIDKKEEDENKVETTRIVVQNVINVDVGDDDDDDDDEEDTIKVFEFSKSDSTVSIQCNRTVIEHNIFLDPINKTTLRYYTSSYWALDLLYYYDQFSALYNPGSNGYSMYIG